MANSVDPDQTPCFVASDLGEHCSDLTVRICELNMLESVYMENLGT